MATDLIELADKSLAFAHSIGEKWQDQPGIDLLSFQRRFLYTQSFASAHTAKSYWILHQQERHSDCKVLARTLLERVFNSRVAAKSPRNAVELMAYELSERVRHLRLLHKSAQNLPKDAQAAVDRLDRELTQFLNILGNHTVPQWDRLRRASEAGIASWAYRGLYSELSCYAHAGFEMSRPQELNQPWRWADFVALFAPVDTAMFVHQLTCRDEPCEVALRYKALFDEFNDKVLDQRDK